MCVSGQTKWCNNFVFECTSICHRKKKNVWHSLLQINSFVQIRHVWQLSWCLTVHTSVKMMCTQHTNDIISTTPSICNLSLVLKLPRKSFRFAQIKQWKIVNCRVNRGLRWQFQYTKLSIVVYWWHFTDHFYIIFQPCWTNGSISSSNGADVQ